MAMDGVTVESSGKVPPPPVPDQARKRQRATDTTLGRVLLDGSMGRQLCVEHGLPDDDLFRQIWSAAALHKPEFHEKVVQVHQDYIKSGSKWITTNSFGVQPNYYAKAGLGESVMLQHAKLSASLAVQARKLENNDSVKVLGCLPPICEAHRPDRFWDYVREHGEPFVKEQYGKLALAMLEGGADCLLMETINNQEEACMALEGISDAINKQQGCDGNVDVIVSLEGALRSPGTLKPRPWQGATALRSVLDCVDFCNGEDTRSLSSEEKDSRDVRRQLSLICVGFNCAPPEEIELALRTVKRDKELSSQLASRQIHLCAYANVNDRKKVHDNGFSVSGDDRKKIQLRSDLVSVENDGHDYSGYVGFVQKFCDYGATAVGGCCGCGPKGIHQINETMFADSC